MTRRWLRRLWIALWRTSDDRHCSRLDALRMLIEIDRLPFPDRAVIAEMRQKQAKEKATR